MSAEKSLAQFADDVDAYYEKLVALYWQQLKVFAASRIGNPLDAEDLVQEVFIRAYVALERYSIRQRQDLKARAWLYKITWNLYYNFISRSPEQQGLSIALGEKLEHEGLEIDDENGVNPEEIFEQAERRQELEALVAGLPRQYQAVVSLYYFEELSLQEVADVLNQPLGTVKVYVRRGIQQLRKTLQMRVNMVG
ncbi:RNA polymerase sigma factor [Dictyobacter alpinus]|uniref:RNA polymerase sigma factor n=1 Tax=Dictyobacter alpinus TaxID=2014873 RepID=UPI0013868EAA|nr:RNA polymerase sigma factor [Dictyobacter alpinus]